MKSFRRLCLVKDFFDYIGMNSHQIGPNENDLPASLSHA